MRSSVWKTALILLPLGLLGCRNDRAPAPPQGVYSVTGDGRVDLYWQPNTERDLRGYNVYVSVRAAVGPYYAIASTQDTHWADTDVQNGSTYWYAVTAVNQDGRESALSEDNVHDTPRPEYLGWTLYDASLEASQGAPYNRNGINLGAHQLLSRLTGKADIYYTTASGQGWLKAGNDSTGVQDAGSTPGGLEQVDFAPTSGWAFGGSMQAVQGHTYLVWTADDHYAKIFIRTAAPDSIGIDWAYQLDRGNRELKVKIPSGRPGASALGITGVSGGVR